MLCERIANADAAGQRLDVFLERSLPGCSRSLIARLIQAGRCRIEGTGPAHIAAKAGYALRGGERICLDVPEVAPLVARPEAMPLTILHADDHLLLIDKPPGMVVHPAVGHSSGTLLNGVLGYEAALGRLVAPIPATHLAAASLSIPPAAGLDGASDADDEVASDLPIAAATADTSAADAAGTVQPALVHRLDADTSGIICVARTAAALHFLQAAFQARTVRKRYLALVAGSPRADFLEHAGWIGRHPRDVRRRAVLPPGQGAAREAYTSVLVHARHPGYAVVEARPRTGRTHQIRVHLAALGHPVLADAVYGRSAQWPLHGSGPGVLRRQALHAWWLDVPHPAGGRLVMEAPIPADLAAFLPRLPRPAPW